MRTNILISKTFSTISFLMLINIWSIPANAIELNWSGQFWSEVHFVKNYNLDASDSGAGSDPSKIDATTKQPKGYYIQGGGANNASFETLFLRVRPKLIVNDNIYIKSEWWLGNPVFGLFGNSVPYSVDQRQYYSNQSGGSTITAQRFWGEFLSDLGTVQVGRAPLDWGLGLVWNSGEELWSRYESTGDMIRLVSKFGAFSFSPAFIAYSTGNSVGGSCAYQVSGLCTPGQGSGGVADYSIALKYENLEEDLETGVNFIKRLGGSNQDAGMSQGPLGTPVGFNYNIWDIYARKKLGKLSLSGELPITSGTLGGSTTDYSTWALATEVEWKATDTWEFRFRGGHAPGQPNSTANSIDKYRGFFFNPNYHIGLIMFNYQLANFSGATGPNTANAATGAVSALKSPFDNPIFNADYLSATALLKTQKWTFNLGVISATAPESAKASDAFFYNSIQRKLVQNTSGLNQGTSLGTEFDVGAAFQWDEYFMFRLDTGFWFPGDFWKYSNTAVENATDTVWATVARIGVSF